MLDLSDHCCCPWWYSEIMEHRRGWCYRGCWRLSIQIHDSARRFQFCLQKAWAWTSLETLSPWMNHIWNALEKIKKQERYLVDNIVWHFGSFLKLLMICQYIAHHASRPQFSSWTWKKCVYPLFSGSHHTPSSAQIVHSRPAWALVDMISL